MSSTEIGGESFFVVLVLVVAFADIGGYFGGRIIGGPKVFEKISPNKTWAGIFLGWITVITFYYICLGFLCFCFFWHCVVITSGGLYRELH